MFSSPTAKSSRRSILKERIWKSLPVTGYTSPELLMADGWRSIKQPTRSKHLPGSNLCFLLRGST
jgi:hypothetical protein